MSSIPSTTWRMLSAKGKDPQLPRGLDAAWDVAAGLVKRVQPRTKKLMDRAARVLALEKQYTDLSDAKLRESAEDFRALFRRGRETPEQVEHAFALVREVAYRQLGEKPYQVQVAGALSVFSGYMTEMATGEGKTLTATMPVVMEGWRGRGAHVITVNDYLAKRDAEWMSKVYRFCGLSTGHISQDMDPPARRENYGRDITYCTNKEACADFLRDRLAVGQMRGLSPALLTKIVRGGGQGVDRCVMRGLAAAIVDEADSVLIDEAVTPLIISGDGPNPEQVEAFQQAVTLARQLEPDKHYRVNFRYREVELTEAGKRVLTERADELGGIWRGSRRREELITQALTAETMYTLGQQYVIQEGKVVIVDEFTGRLMPDRTWRDGLHQAVEAKEGLEVQPPKDTFARLSFQRFFRLYGKLSGMTGTAAEAVSEFWQIYHLPVAVIPTNRPCIRTREPDRVYATEDGKFNAIVEEIRRVHRQGRPVLVGTRSVQASQHLSQMLTALELEHEVLNALREAEEAQIVAGAGQHGRITVATNMAGRGTDIKLGRGVAELGGLHVIASERHEAGRVDRQLFGRAGRQGDPGSAVAIVSLEDELPRRYGPNVTPILQKRAAGKTGDIADRWLRAHFDRVQKRAEKQAQRQRKQVLQTDNWLDEYLGFAGAEG